MSKFSKRSVSLREQSFLDQGRTPLYLAGHDRFIYIKINSIGVVTTDDWDVFDHRN